MTNTRIYWNEIVTFQTKYFPKWRNLPAYYWSNALAGEVGEICNTVKHLVGGGTKAEDYIVTFDKLKEEIGDTLIYFVLICMYYDISPDNLDTIFENTLSKNIRRKEEVPKND